MYYFALNYDFIFSNFYRFSNVSGHNFYIIISLNIDYLELCVASKDNYNVNLSYYIGTFNFILDSMIILNPLFVSVYF